jgi:hypothetical protein
MKAQGLGVAGLIELLDSAGLDFEAARAVALAAQMVRFKQYPDAVEHIGQLGMEALTRVFSVINC